MTTPPRRRPSLPTGQPLRRTGRAAGLRRPGTPADAGTPQDTGVGQDTDERAGTAPVEQAPSAPAPADDRADLVRDGVVGTSTDQDEDTAEQEAAEAAAEQDAADRRAREVEQAAAAAAAKTTKTSKTTGSKAPTTDDADAEDAEDSVDADDEVAAPAAAPKPRPRPAARRPAGKRRSTGTLVGDEPRGGRRRPAARPAPATRTAPARPGLNLAIVLAVVALITAGLAFWFKVKADALTTGADTDNSAITDVASTEQVKNQVRTAIEKVFTYDYTNLAATQEAVKANLDQAALCDYNAIFGQVQQAAPAQQLKLTSQVRDVGVVSLRGSDAELLVFVDQTVVRGATVGQAQAGTSAGGAQLAVRAHLDGGVWKITAFDTLGQSGAAQQQAAGC
ncbi:hypothetical protein [Actinokineospora bangkokensis]|uniref:Mce-associated membrane protein n=1 Tax=Actinokineospora bangkokensis TaxID=1193682 RepID=A0A1Q9LF35_9PSEU|nr:hypothetical protein [Actinokineospora bangkokensis]OLR90652.1 hypothetical protein BJP25_29000 [Actinokineospora bangkokensis]